MIKGSFRATQNSTPVNLGELRLGSAGLLDGASPRESHHRQHPSAIEDHTLTVWSLRPVGGSSWTTRLLDRVRGSCVCPWARLTRATINREAVHRRPVDSRTEAQTWLRSKPPNIRPLAPWDVLTHDVSVPFPFSVRCPPPHAWALWPQDTSCFPNQFVRSRRWVTSSSWRWWQRSSRPRPPGRRSTRFGEAQKWSSRPRPPGRRGTRD